MTDGGIETAGWRDKFASHSHTNEHLATGILVVAGGCEDSGGILRGGTVL